MYSDFFHGQTDWNLFYLPDQGILTEGEGSVRSTTSLRYFVHGQADRSLFYLPDQGIITEGIAQYG